MMKTTKFEDELTGSEFADVQSFEDLRVQVLVTDRMLVPQMFDGPFGRVKGRGLPFNPLGCVTLPICCLPESLRGLVQVDGLMGEVDNRVKRIYNDLITNPDNKDVPLERLKELAIETAGTYCVAGPDAEGIELEYAEARGGWNAIEVMRDEMRNRNKPQDLIFLGRTLEIVLRGERKKHIRPAEALKWVPRPTNNFLSRREQRLRDECGKRAAIYEQSIWNALLPHQQMIYGQGTPMTVDKRREKFELVATKIIIHA